MVSVIIPAFNRMDCTVRCMAALFQHTRKIPHEFILVDNASTDGTRDYLQGLGEQVRVITNRTNQGFSRACNQGAATAQGNTLVFLNNDTQVQPNWLEPLIAPLADETVGLVGSRLLYPNGTIQHAGIVSVNWEEKSQLFFDHIYRGLDGQDPRVCQAKKFQYVTGACIALRHSDFKDLGGFDEGYWNGAEDMDLCARIRARGLKVIYQPASCVIHEESQSGPERNAKLAHNIQRLAQIWQGKLQPDFIIKDHKVHIGPAQTIQAYGGNHTQQTLADMTAYLHHQFIENPRD